MSTGTTDISFTVLGEPCSKANSRRIVKFGSRPASIKSKKALSFEAAFHLQCPQLDILIEDDVRVTITIYYASRRPDLDESIILDSMQTHIYKNDRQVKEKHIFWGLDAINPRSEIRVESLGRKG